MPFGMQKQWALSVFSVSDACKLRGTNPIAASITVVGGCMCGAFGLVDRANLFDKQEWLVRIAGGPSNAPSISVFGR